MTALAVKVPEAEQWVRDLRSLYDPSAKRGMPAHITILVPFMRPELVTAGIRGEISEALSSVCAFEFTLPRVGRFPATTYLAPEPSAPFVALTTALVTRFPAFPASAGEFETVVPHLTVAHGDAARAQMVASELEAILRERGSIHSICHSVTLLENSLGVWRQMHEFNLAKP